MTCKDCFDYQICKEHEDYAAINYLSNTKQEENCDFFKDKNMFIKLPCKIGDVVYFINKYNGNPIFGVQADYIQKICISRNSISIVLRNNKSFGKSYVLGKTVFLTKDEAEEKLKEMRENDSKKM